MRRRARTVSEDEVRQELARFERAYEIPSDEFLRRWHAGALDDRPDFFEWFGAYHLAVKVGILAQPRQHALG